MLSSTDDPAEQIRLVRRGMSTTAVVALVAGLLIVAANVSITYTIRESPSHLAQVVGRYMLTTFAGELEKVAEKEMSPDREARIHCALRMTAARLKPFAGDLAPGPPAINRGNNAEFAAPRWMAAGVKHCRIGGMGRKAHEIIDGFR